MVETVEYFNNRNGKLDSVFSKYFPNSSNLYVDTALSKTIYYYDNQLRLIKTINTKAESALNYDTDYIFKMEYQYNDYDQIEQINKIQLSNQQEWNRITKIQYLENNQVEVWREKAGINGENTKAVYFFSDNLLLLKVRNYNFKNELWQLTTEETYEFVYY